MPKRLIDGLNAFDCVKIKSKDPLYFEIISRKSDVLNIGGYNIYPHEIEEILERHPEINNAKVYSNPTSIMNILCCDIVLEKDMLTKKDIMGSLEGRTSQKCSTLMWKNYAKTMYPFCKNLLFRKSSIVY